MQQLARISTLLLIAVVAATSAACDNAPAATEVPAEPTTAVPDVTPEPTLAGYAPDTVLSIIEGPLRVRSKPTVDADSEKFNPLLATGQRVLVMSGPVAGSGYSSWYLVRSVAKRVTQDGWISAAARDGTPWVEPNAVDCPESATLADIGALDPALRIPCFRGQELTFTTTITWGAQCGDGVLVERPDWMSGCLTTFRWGGKTSSVFVAVPPELNGAVGTHQLGDTLKATVTAHLDDAAAQTCTPKPNLPGDPVIVAATVILDCRAMFVATAFEKQ
jgi:hypothetical protein